MLTGKLGRAIEMFHKDKEQNRLLRYMCWEAKQARQYIEQSKDEIRRVLLCDWSKEESDYFCNELSPTEQAYYMQDKINGNPLHTEPN